MVQMVKDTKKSKLQINHSNSNISTLLALTACGTMGDLAKGLPGGDLIAAGVKAKELADKAEKFNENIAKRTTQLAGSKADETKATEAQ